MSTTYGGPSVSLIFAIDGASRLAHQLSPVLAKTSLGWFFLCTHCHMPHNELVRMFPWCYKWTPQGHSRIPNLSQWSFCALALMFQLGGNLEARNCGSGGWNTQREVSKKYCPDPPPSNWGPAQWRTLPGGQEHWEPPPPNNNKNH